MKKFYLFVLLSCLGYSANAALNSYVFAYATGTYTSVTSSSPGYAVVMATPFDDDLVSTTLPFDFIMDGVTFAAGSNVYVSSNGWIELGGSSDYYYNPISYTPDAGSYTIAALGGDLQSAASGAVAITRATYGTAPNRTFVIDYQKIRNYNGSQNYNFQVRLYESSNVIQVQYGSFTGGNGSNPKEVGLGTSSSFSNRTKAGSTVWASTTAGGSNTATVAFTNVFPVAGSTFTWTPPPFISVSPVSMVFTQTVSTTSASQLATVRAYGLTSGSVTVTAPANYQVYNGSSWVTSMTVPTVSAASGTYINTTVQVRFVAPATTGTYTGNLSFASTGATTRNIPLTGNVTSPCSGTPSPGTVTSSTTSGACSAYTTNLSLSGATVAGGINYQWQTSPDNSSWTDISGATTATYAATISATAYIRARLTCTSSGGGSATTPGVLHTLLSCILMPASGSTSYTTCGSAFYDSGGPSGSYTDNESGTVTIYPGATGTGSKVSVTFSSFTLETCCDNLKIYNGNSVAAPLVGTYTSSPGTVTSTASDGSLTFRFSSDGSVTYNGFAATITNTNPNPITAQPSAISTCVGNSASLSVAASGTNTYQWYNNGGTNSNSGGTLIAGATNASYAPSTASAGTTYYYVIVKNACNVSFTSNAAGVIVNTNPVSIAGPSYVCAGNITTLTNGTSGGTWTSGTTTIATINPTTGAVTGILAGTVNISYTLSTGCRSIKIFTVSPLPASITGTPTVCVGATATLNEVTTGGTWTSGSSVATITTVGTAGVINGISAGLAPVTYTITSTGCLRWVMATVNPVPSIVISPSSPVELCESGSTSFTATSPALEFSLLAQDFNSGPGSWTINSPNGPSDSHWQIRSAPAMGNGGDGSPMMEASPFAGSGGLTETYLTSPSFSTVGYGSAILAFNEYLFTATSSDLFMKIEYSVNGGSTWNLLADRLPVVNTDSSIGTGSWVTSEPEESISMPAGALGQPDVILRWSYKTNYGGWWQIDNITVKAALPAATFTWAGVGGATGLSCTSCASPSISPSAMGANVYSVTASSTCSNSTSVTVSVNPLPGSIAGTSALLCEGSSITLSNSMSGVTWSSGDASVATVTTGGVVTGVSAGNVTVTVWSPSGCFRTAIVTVQPAPAPITGTLQVCEGGFTTTLSSASAGGAWSSGSASNATVNPTLGIVTGGNAGLVTIIYEGTSGCTTSAVLTVNPTPSAITGTRIVCEEATTTLASASTGGTWSSLALSSASVAPSSGVVTGVANGTATIVYTLPTGCKTDAVVSVNTTPVTISGGAFVCEGASTTLSNSTGGGAWSSSVTAVANIDAASGIINAGDAGNSEISYTLSTGCYRTVTLTVNALPGLITGTPQVCEEGTTLLSSSPAGGSWTTSASTVADVDGSGLVSAVLNGTADISYILSTGCSRSLQVSVNPLPADIAGPSAVCVDANVVLTNTTSGGAWSTQDGSVASVDAATGEVLGIGAGTVNIVYTLSTGCAKYAQVVVNSLPAAIGGTPVVCEGSTTLLTNANADGTWSSLSPGIASVDASTGVVTGLTGGNVASINYTLPTGCVRNGMVTVTALPEDIAGVAEVCESLTTTLSNLTGGGVWSIDATTFADIDVNGVVSGVAFGTAEVYYTLPTGCLKSRIVTVNALPADIAGTPVVCEGSVTMLSNVTPGGSWSSTNLSVAQVDADGSVLGAGAGNAGVIYTLPTGCAKSANVLVNPLPAAISGPAAICENAAGMYSNAVAGGNWTSSNSSVADIDGDGMVSALIAGNTIITYQLVATGCQRTAALVVNPLPAAIAGPDHVCENSAISLSNPTPGGSWSSLSTSNADIDVSGVVTGNAAGNAAIVYTLPTGCSRSGNVVVDPLPAVITGTLAVCEGAVTTVYNANTDGSWSTDAITTASISDEGIVSGIVAGTASVIYTLPTGCKRSVEATVNALPALIDGITQVCEGGATNLSNVTPGGSWISADGTIAAVDAASGAVSGMIAGSVDVIYELPTGCQRITNVQVNPLPGFINGNVPVCEAQSIILTNTMTGGTWTTGDVAVASIDPTNGVVTGNAAGSINVSYTSAAGCSVGSVLTVQALPDAITGTFQVCAGSLTAVADATPGGTWSVVNTSVASIDASGNVTGVSAGATDVIYTIPTGCQRIATMVVNEDPAPILGVFQVCEGGTTALANTITGGFWTTTAANASVDIISGVVSAVSAGNADITYTLLNGCSGMATVSIDPLPAAIVGAPGVCIGSSALLSSATSGGAWNSGTPAVVTIDGMGTVTGMSAGVADITYTASTGCQATAAIQVHTLPAVYPVAGGGSYCAGTSGSVISMPNSEVDMQYQLMIGGIPSGGVEAGSGAGFNFAPQTTAGVYTVRAVDPVTGCAADMAGSATVTITPVSIPSVTMSSDAGLTVCDGTNVTFTAAPVNGGTLPAYAWEVNGMPMTGTGSSFNYIPANGDIVKVTLTSNAICATPATVVDQLTMAVNSNQVPLVSIALPAGVTSVCKGSNVTLTATPVFGGSSPVYDWRVNGVSVSATGATLTYAPNNGDVVKAIMTSNYACVTTPDATSSPLTMITTPVLIPIVNISATPGTFIASGTPVTFMAVLGGTAGASPTYQWYRNGAAIPGATNVSYTNAALADNDSISCNVMGTGPCSFESFNSVIMHVKTTGLSSVSAGDIRLLPNPNRGEFMVKGTLENNGEPVKMEITNMLGQTVYSRTIAANGNIAEHVQLANNLANGMYMITLHCPAGNKVITFVLEQ